MRILILAALAAFFTSANAEMVMQTEAGKVTLSDAPCTLEAPKGIRLPYQAVATDGASVHYGCWGRDDPYINAWFPDCKCLAQFHQHLFEKFEGEL